MSFDPTSKRLARLCALILAIVGSGAGLEHAVAQEFRPQIELGAVEVPTGDLFIQNLDAIWTAAGEVLENHSILIRDGKIRAIGPDLSPPSGVQVIDGSGYTAMPGIVDSHSHIAMASTNESSAPVVPEVRVIDALNPLDFGIYRALSGGVTTAQILHGSSNPIGGQSAIIKTRWGMDDSKTLLVQGAPQTVKFALGENVTRKGGGGSGPTRFPASREGVEATYVAAFEAARAYRQAWDDYEANPSAYPAPPRRDLRLEALVDIMEGEIRVHAHSYRSDEIVMLIRVAERFGFKIDVFTHVLEGFKVADEMAAHGAGGSTFSDWWQYKLEAYDAIPYNATVMQEHGVVTSLNSDIPWLQTFLREEMAKPVKYGAVSPEEAMRMLTLYPAMQLLIEDRVGSLEVGKDGDVLLLSGHPFNTYSRVEQTIVDGIVYYDRTREVEMRGEPVRSMPDFAPSVSGDFGLGAPESLDQEALPESAREDAPPLVTDRVYALVGATIHPVSGPAIENGVVVVQEGRISAVGSAASVEIPPDARRVDVSGKHVYPGMIDPITQMGMAEIGQVAASRDDRETGKYNPHIRGLTGVHPHSEAIPVARANGVLASLAVPGSGVIQGAGSLIQLDGDTPERMEIEDRAAIVVNLPSPSGKSWDDPKLEGDELESLLDLFARARLYANRPSVRERADEPFDPNIRFGQAHLLEALVPAVTGTMPVYFRAQRERDIRTVLLVQDSFPEMKPVIVGGDQAFRVAEELAARDIPVIVGSGLTPTMDRDDPLSAGWRNAGILAAAGVKIAFGTNDVAGVRNLPYHAARSVAYGLPQEEAMKALTLNAAEILGVSDQMGSIEVGKRADLIVTDGDPMQIITHVDRAFINGVEVPLISKQTELFKKFRNRRGRGAITTQLDVSGPAAFEASGRAVVSGGGGR
jgi:imidazolonepropionase-like amidohydrolase